MASAQVKNSFNSIGEIDASFIPSSLELRLSVSDQAIRYFVLSQIHHQLICFGDYTLHHILHVDELTTQLKKIYEKDEILQLAYGKVIIGFDGKYSLVPVEFSDAISSGGEMSQIVNETKIVFETTPGLLICLKKLFPDGVFSHLSSTYLKSLPEFLDDSKQKLFVCVGKSYFDVILFDTDKKLHLMNRYEYMTAADFIYFTLLCCDEMKIDRETVELILLGEIDIQSKIYDMCHRYFRVISFIQKPTGVHFAKAFERYPKHLHFNLYNLKV